MRSIVLGLLAVLIPQIVLANEPPPNLERIRHIVVLYLENRSFDNIYGLFPGAAGVADAGQAAIQVDLNGNPYSNLPPVVDTEKHPPIIDSRFPGNLPNEPFRAEPFISLLDKSGDLVHRFYQEQAQIDGGKMDKFAAVSNAGGLTMSYFDGSSLPLWNYARQYTLADHYFHGAFGGSFLNHLFLICACAPRFEDAPAGLKAELDSDGHLRKDGVVTPDGYAVNTIQPTYAPHADGPAPDRLPPQTARTIGDRLSDKDISWAWYAGGFADAVAGHPDRYFEFHHQPFVYFANYGEGTKARAEHLKDETDFVKDITDNTLPAVSFWKPVGEEDEHPGYADVLDGDRHAADLIERIQNSPAWKDTVIIVTYDENGGLWDHVAPPQIDRWGPGTRVPLIIISPFAKRGYVDHTPYDTSSILSLIELRYGLAPLGERDAHAAPMLNSLDLH